MKIAWLAANPLPDGDLNKRVRGLDGIDRLRIRDYRLFYFFGDTWIRLLAVLTRRDAYDNMEGLEWEEPVVLPPPGAPDYAEDRPSAGAPSHGGVGAEAREEAAAASAMVVEPRPPGLTPSGGEERRLPRRITPTWLAELQVPEEYHAALSTCVDEDSLLSAPVPAWVLDRVVDNLWERPLEEVIQQPDFVVQNPEDLERYREGDLLGFLLKLDEEQAELASWRLSGPAIIKGGPGTGKSTVALYRVKSLLECAEAARQPAPRILFTTYTNALTRFSEQLLVQLLGDRARLVTVSTADHLARTIAERVGHVPDPLDDAECDAAEALVNVYFRQLKLPGLRQNHRAIARESLNQGHSPAAILAT